MLDHLLDTCVPSPETCPAFPAEPCAPPGPDGNADGHLKTLLTSEKVVLRFEGQMDTGTCGRIEAGVRAATTRPAKPIEFDLGAVDFISSAFLRLCVYAWQQAGRDGFQIVNASPCVKRVFKIAGLDRMLRPE